MGEENKRAPLAAIMAIKKPTTGYSWENNPVGWKKTTKNEPSFTKEPGRNPESFREKIEATLS